MWYLHSAGCKALFNHFHQTLEEWLQKTYGSQSVGYWLIGLRWWERIKGDFINIFKHVMGGLSSIHAGRKYHRNLWGRIVLSKDLHGLLYDMKLMHDNN